MHAERHTVTITTNTSGAGTGYTPNITGRVLSIQYVKADYADGVDFDVTGEETALQVWSDDDVNASVTVYPVSACVLAADGAASTLTETPVVLVNERVKIVVGSGGNTKTGTFHVIVG